ncbi:MAG: methyltransferase domain-containing protein [Candidatus Micrarchaeota archaeon]|nr:methyltransferase domain-containing protein [Candidatus Micrarchaeota archaeon]
MPEFFNELPDDLRKMRRGAAVVLPKDFGAVVAFTGITKDSVVAEAGTGTGFMAVQLARVVKKVYTYEIKEEHYKTAKSNIEKLGLDNVELVHGPIESLDRSGLDLIFLDFKGSAALIQHAHAHIKDNGWLVSYHPNIEQAKEFHLGCNKVFRRTFTITSSVMHYVIRDFGCRPDNFGMVHTGYLAFAQK